MIRKVRAVLVIGGLWGLAWLPVGLLLGFRNQRLVDRMIPSPPHVWLRSVVDLVLWMAASGALFSVVLGFAEAGRSVAKLSRLRAALWGAVGCAIVAVLYAAYDVARRPYSWRDALALSPLAILIYGALGAICAVGTLAFVRTKQGSERDVA